MEPRRSLPEDPVSAWLEMLARRKGPSLAPWLSFSAAAALALLPLLLLWMVLATTVLENWLQGDPLSPLRDPFTREAMRDALGGGASVSIFLTLLIGPVAHAMLTARLLGSFRKARVLEEVVATPLTSRRVVDALALHGMRRTLGVLVPPLAFCAACFLLSGWPGQALLLALLPASWALYWFFAMLASKAWDGEAQRSESGLVFSLLRVVGIFGPLGIMASLGGRVAFFAGPAAGAAVLVLLSVFWGLIHRELAVRGLDSDSWLRKTLRNCSTSTSRRPRSLVGGSPNALLFRDQASRSGTLQQRLLSWGLWGIPLASLFLAVLVGPQDALGIFTLLWPLMGGLAVLRVLHASSLRLHEERQQGSLELLLQSGLTVQEFVEGCVGVAAGRGRRLLLPLVLATCVVVLSALAGGSGRGEPIWWLVAWMALVGVLASEAAAAWGTSMAADCGHRPQPAGVVVTFLTAAGIGWGLVSSLGFLLFLPAAAAVGLGGSPDSLLGEILALLLLAALPVGLFMVRLTALVSARKTLLHGGRTIGFVGRVAGESGPSREEGRLAPACGGLR